MKTSRLLLDTHVFLWWKSAPRKLAEDVLEAISSADLVFVSAASAWEAAIKSSLGKLRLPFSFEEGVEDSNFEKLPVLFSHARHVAQLPPHHRDPFDRLLVAQAQAEDLCLVSRDRQFQAYDVKVVWAR